MIINLLLLLSPEPFLISDVMSSDNDVIIEFDLLMFDILSASLQKNNLKKAMVKKYEVKYIYVLYSSSQSLFFLLANFWLI